VSLYAVCFLNANVGWAAGDKVLRTLNGGRKWRAVSVPYGGLQAVDFVSAKKGWAVGGDGGKYVGRDHYRVILHTSDGGASWQTQLYESIGPGPDALHAVDFVSATRGWAVGEHGLILATTDGGTTRGAAGVRHLPCAHRRQVHQRDVPLGRG
jgi:photosystem II stability/assembly factor-like uncharacterized protein